MTVGDACPAAGIVPDVDLPAAARALVGDLLAMPWGQVSPSVYETGRLVALAPWLTGHRRRLEYLVAAQRPDGGWGGPGGYALVPTLSAVEAVLASLASLPPAPTGSGTAEVPDPESLLRAAERGLRFLACTLPAIDACAVPDMPALDLIVTSLTDAINDRLARAAPPGLRFAGRLSPPAGVDGARLAMVQAAVRGGAGLPAKILHALEVAGSAARGHPAIHPEESGTVGASAAATAAWLDAPGENGAWTGSRRRAERFLERVVADHDGLAPCGIPVTVFERSWVLSGLARAGLEVDVPPRIVADLAAALGPHGAAAAGGLPVDADTTSVTLHALGLLGVQRAPDALWEFETDTHFCTWPGEQGFSVSVNAHVLDAFGQYLRARRASRKACAPAPSETPGAAADGPADRYRTAVLKLTDLLRDRQRADGSWVDRWHASPYYATACCALALHDFGGRAAAEAVRRARDWVVTTQRPDGSWGRWEGSAEETAYGLQILALTRSARPEVQESFTRGYEFLHRAARNTLENGAAGPALWHDKDLYYPAAIVRASVVSALHLAATSRTAPDQAEDRQ
ncbi:prenyltransferase/squalene oxidase repeat-containing protein [Actinomadura sp. NEAU-AAG7]|uniref:prenyltransferase/squalene oxidase repeat-containing protein n=1 Tax=Actinomadura sp. NEAU-AAG7 TaxID=2839640 RepID=UPI0027E05035|nr:prenyltransferase/squalene oxidase repeat-containing protein [Actinomadura sp. NEAU-AAG7]